MSDDKPEARLSQNEMAAIHQSAEAALLRAIQAATDSVAAASYSEGSKAGALETLALAYRYTVGGAQPGSVIVKK